MPGVPPMRGRAGHRAGPLRRGRKRRYKTLAMRTPRLAIIRTNDSVLSHVAAAGTSALPTTIKVLIAREDPKPLANTSTPETDSKSCFAYRARRRHLLASFGAPAPADLW